MGVEIGFIKIFYGVDLWKLFNMEVVLFSYCIVVQGCDGIVIIIYYIFIWGGVGREGLVKEKKLRKCYL